MVHPGRLLAWLLGRCAGVEEAVEELSRLTLVDESRALGRLVTPTKLRRFVLCHR